LSEYLKGRRKHLGDLGENATMILKWNLEKEGFSVWIKVL
jgi:hypothetical protein